MDRRAYGVNRHKTKRNNVLSRVIGKSGLNKSGLSGKSGTGRRIPLTLENIALIIMPLVLMLILIPEPKSETVGNPAIDPLVTQSKDTIIVYNVADSIIDEFNLEEYIVGVVAAEMPASFHPEALKAQAIAARTFALSRARGLYSTHEAHFGASVCTESGHCQGYISKDKYLENRGSEGAWEKISDAVLATEGIVMTYAGQLINPLYHSNSGGVTEDIEQVWSELAQVPYLKSVYSADESLYEGFESIKVLSWDEIKKQIIEKYPEAVIEQVAAKELEVMSYSTSGRIEKIRIGDIALSGTKFRELFSLPSTNLEFAFLDDNKVEIKSKGYGHGVGMSQCGADALAKTGLDYKEILAYFYAGIKVQELR